MTSVGQSLLLWLKNPEADVPVQPFPEWREKFPCNAQRFVESGDVGVSFRLPSCEPVPVHGADRERVNAEQDEHSLNVCLDVQPERLIRR